MPLYEYRCTACNKLTEKRQKFSDPELTECPYCSGRLERTITAPAVQFKGGGWYADLYSKGGGKKPEAANASSEGGSSGEPAKSAEGSSKAEAGASTNASAPASTPAAAPSSPTPAASPAK